VCVYKPNPVNERCHVVVEKVFARLIAVRIMFVYLFYFVFSPKLFVRILLELNILCLGG